MNILLFILACAGATQILVFGHIFKTLRDKVRKKTKLLDCSMCTGFHVGWVMFILFALAGINLFPSYYMGLFVFACISSITSYALTHLFGDSGIQVVLVRDKEE